MNRSTFIIAASFIAGILFSCKKVSVLQKPGDAQWIKIVSDSSVSFTGKIRADAQNNLFCSYSYFSPAFSNNSAIVKFDSKGIVLWRTEFPNTTIYDFAITSQGEAVAVSYLKGMVTLSKISVSGDVEILGIYGLPTLETNGNTPHIIKNNFEDITAMKIFIDSEGNFNISGSFLYLENSIDYSVGFMMEVSPSSGGLLWEKKYILDTEPKTATITGCAETTDGFILFGNTVMNIKTITADTPSMVVSSFFTIKTSSSGDSPLSKNFTTSNYHSDSQTYDGYYCNTTDILPANDGSGNFYASAYNILYNTPGQYPFSVFNADPNSARVFTINAQGDTIHSFPIKFSDQNFVADFAVKKDGGLLVGLNPYRLINFGFIGERHSFMANVSSGLAVENVSAIQTQYSDYLGSVCTMPDGHCAVETMIQSFGKKYYNLEVIKTDENGNF